MTLAILAGAVILFVLLAGQLMAATLHSLFTGEASVSPAAASTLILNIALILFAWQRSRALGRDRDARIDAESRALASATLDFTTGLLNRGAFTEAAEAAFASGGSDLCLIVIDLDHFKKVNDLYGHSAGDTLLRTIARRLRDAVPADSICGRLGGDEFALLVRGPAASAATVDQAAERLIAEIGLPVPIDGGHAQVGASIGLARYADDLAGFGALLRRGDIAMYHAKKKGRGGVAWFDMGMEAEALRQTQLEAEMRAGIAAGEFVPFFQPQFSLESDSLHGFEVLARWNHPRLGLLEPAHFLSLAEATGLIAPLSLSVMRQALSSAMLWDPGLRICVNVSSVQLKDPLFDQRVMKLLAETGFPAPRLELEITEAALFENVDLVLRTMDSLKALGITISLDDFGTGYATLAQLDGLPFDRIKIDRGFTLSLIEKKESAAIISAIAMLGQSLRLPVTAEGVETKAILQRLSELGCSEGQGWHYGPALSIEEIHARFPGLLVKSDGEEAGDPSPAGAKQRVA